MWMWVCKACPLSCLAWRWWNILGSAGVFMLVLPLLSVMVITPFCEPTKVSIMSSWSWRLLSGWFSLIGNMHLGRDHGRGDSLPLNQFQHGCKVRCHQNSIPGQRSQAKQDGAVLVVADYSSSCLERWYILPILPKCNVYATCGTSYTRASTKYHSRRDALWGFCWDPTLKQFHKALLHHLPCWKSSQCCPKVIASAAGITTLPGLTQGCESMTIPEASLALT